MTAHFLPRKAAFAVLRGRPREVAFQVLYQDDLNPGASPSMGEDLIAQRLTLDEYLEFRADDRGPLDEEEPAGEAAALSRFGRDELLAYAQELLRGVRGEDLAAMPRPELAQLIRNDAVEFARALLAGVRRNRAAIDEKLQAAAENWSLDRMAATDRNVLRLGAYELLHHDTPERVAIDEAVELAKRFGSAQSGPFVNGILNRLLQQKG